MTLTYESPVDASPDPADEQPQPLGRNWSRLVLAAVLAVVALVVFASVLLGLGLFAGSAGESPDELSGGPTVTGMATSSSGDGPGANSVGAAETAGLSGAFLEAVNSGDPDAVIDLAPGAAIGTVDFLIGGGPYDSVDCAPAGAATECRMVNGIADFTFLVDDTNALVTNITYVGGE